MRIALAVPRTTHDWQTNVLTMGAMATQAATQGAAMILFSEAAVTGFAHTGDPVADLMSTRAIANLKKAGLKPATDTEKSPKPQRLDF